MFDVNLCPPFAEPAIIETLLQRADWVKLKEVELHTVGRWHGVKDGICQSTKSSCNG